MTAAIIINPVSGGSRHGRAERRVALAHDLLGRLHIDGDVTVTEDRGHGHELARARIADGVETVVAWGGDGTVNEVASAVAFHSASLGIVPAGSGNGLAWELGLPWHPERALEVALRGRTRGLDVGELGSRLFFNIAGVGLDAHLAGVFNALTHRGAAAYARAFIGGLRGFHPGTYTIVTGDTEVTDRALAVVLANTRQYGNRAVIAPLAKPDDGLLELVSLPALSAPAILWQARRLFTGTLHRVRGVRMSSVADVRIRSEQPLAFHVDGEAVTGARELRGLVHPLALRVRVP